MCCCMVASLFCVLTALVSAKTLTACWFRCQAAPHWHARASLGQQHRSPSSVAPASHTTKVKLLAVQVCRCTGPQPCQGRPRDAAGDAARPHVPAQTSEAPARARAPLPGPGYARRPVAGSPARLGSAALLHGVAGERLFSSAPQAPRAARAAGAARGQLRAALPRTPAEARAATERLPGALNARAQRVGARARHAVVWREPARAGPRQPRHARSRLWFFFPHGAACMPGPRACRPASSRHSMQARLVLARTLPLLSSATDACERASSITPMHAPAAARCKALDRRRTELTHMSSRRASTTPVTRAPRPRSGQRRPGARTRARDEPGRRACTPPIVRAPRPRPLGLGLGLRIPGGAHESARSYASSAPAHSWRFSSASPRLFHAVT